MLRADHLTHTNYLIYYCNKNYSSFLLNNINFQANLSCIETDCSIKEQHRRKKESRRRKKTIKPKGNKKKEEVTNLKKKSKKKENTKEKKGLSATNFTVLINEF